jgi:hypothetical protein
MQKASGNHCIKKMSQVSVVHENCYKPILTIENKYYYYHWVKVPFEKLVKCNLEFM